MMHLASSWLLLLLPLPWLVRKMLSPVVLKQDAGLKVPFYRVLNKLTADSRSDNHSKQYGLACLAWFFLVLAAAGPQWLGKAVDLPRSGRDILLAIDISGSMQIPDMEINGRSADRLSVVKRVAQQFIKDRAGDRLGLILFGSRAYLQTPLTFDLATVRHMLLDSTVGLAGTQTAIGDAIGMAVKHFKKFPTHNKVLILLTDGVNNEGKVNPIEAAAIAAKYGIRIYTVGLGSNQVVVPSFLGPQVVSGEYELDEATLKQIAGLTQGIYFRAKDPHELNKVYAQLNKIEPRVSDKESFRPKTPLYHWPLGIALALVVIILINATLPLSRLLVKQSE
jgi:Ca-activated chloride channel homolog